MIHYHGTPITPVAAAHDVLRGRHALVSFNRTDNIALVAEICQSFILDNGAFTMWKSGKTPEWQKYYDWVEKWKNHPACDWAIIPDVIDGSEEDNDRLLEEWPHEGYGVPVWHMNESLDRLSRLATGFRRVCLGSSGQYAKVGTPSWWGRMDEAMESVCDSEGRPRTKLHGLRMLNPKIFGRVPLSSGDSSMVGTNINLDSKWTGAFAPKSKQVRALVLADRIESNPACSRWEGSMKDLTHVSCA